MQKEVEYILQGENNWKIAFNGHFYSVNMLGKIIFQLIIDGYSNHEILSELYLQGHKDVADAQIQTMRTSIEHGKRKGKSTPIRFRITILDLKRWQNVLGNLTFLFNPYVAFGIFVAFFLLSYVQYEYLKNNLRHSGITTVGVWVNIFITLFIMLCHEFGHATSSLKYKVPPMEIGFGIYLYFPVLFTDVSRSWMASRQQRIVVDLSGIYFQFILMTLFLFFNYFLQFPHYVAQAFMINNLGIIFYNLNPLFKFDGYWLFCDLFNISNLRTKSLNAFAELICKIFRKKELGNWRHSSSIYIYSLLSISFLIFVIVSFLTFLVRSSISFSHQLLNGTPMLEQVLLGTIKICILTLGGYLSISAFLKTLLTIRQNVQLYTTSK